MFPTSHRQYIADVNDSASIQKVARMERNSFLSVPHFPVSSFLSVGEAFWELSWKYHLSPKIQGLTTGGGMNVKAQIGSNKIRGGRFR